MGGARGPCSTVVSVRVLAAVPRSIRVRRVLVLTLPACSAVSLGSGFLSSAVFL